MAGTQSPLEVEPMRKLLQEERLNKRRVRTTPRAGEQMRMNVRCLQYRDVEER